MSHEVADNPSRRSFRYVLAVGVTCAVVACIVFLICGGWVNGPHPVLEGRGAFAPFVVAPKSSRVIEEEPSDGVVVAAYVTRLRDERAFWDLIEGRLAKTRWFPCLEHRGIRVFCRSSPRLCGSDFGAHWERVSIRLDRSDGWVSFRYEHHDEFGYAYWIGQRGQNEELDPGWGGVWSLARYLRMQGEISSKEEFSELALGGDSEDGAPALRRGLLRPTPGADRRNRIDTNVEWEFAPDQQAVALRLGAGRKNVLECTVEGGRSVTLVIDCVCVLSGKKLKRELDLAGKSHMAVISPFPWQIEGAVVKGPRGSGSVRGRYGCALLVGY